MRSTFRLLLKILAGIVAVVIVLVVAVLAFASTKPDTFTITRTANIEAPAEEIFPLINDFKGWAAWSPFEQLDPTMQKTYSGAASGEGAVYVWSGDDMVGEGRMEIIESTSPTKIGIKLDFVRPMASTNETEFTLVPAGDATQVTWAMRGPNPFAFKVMSIFLDTDALIGKDFETGLANLKTLTEG